MADTAANGGAPVLELRGVSKHFGGARETVRPSERGQWSGPEKPQESALE